MSGRENQLGQPIGAPLPDWQPRPLPPATVMQGRTVRLEKLSALQHGEDLWTAFQSDHEGRVWTYLPDGPFERRDDFDGFLSRCEASPDPMFFAILDQARDKAVGFASFLRFDARVGSIEVGYIAFSPGLQRSRQATECMYLMMARVFDELGYRRYEWKCDSLNAPSRKAAERLGFRYEGLFRQATIYKQRNRDTCWFSIVDSEWPGLKREYERWLADENFNADGSQKTRLAVPARTDET